MAYKEIRREEIPAPLLQALARDSKLRIVEAKGYQVAWDYKKNDWHYFKYEDNHKGEKSQ
jgi:hypothetical protein